MPQLTGLSLSAAFARTNAAGLRIAAAEEPAPTTLGPTSTPPGAAAPGTPGYHDSFFVGAPAPTQTPATTPIYSHAFPVTNGAPAVTSSTAGTVTGQSPLAGHRVMRGESVRLTITH